MLSQYMQELEQEPFDPEEFVERLAWRSTTGSSGGKSGTAASFQPDLLHMTFTQAIKDLEVLSERAGRKCKKLEEAVAEEEQQHWRNIAKLLDANLAAFAQFQQLDGQMNRVAARVVHLGDQLEAVNTPRARAAEAHTLMMHFAGYLTPPEEEDDDTGTKDVIETSVLGDTPQQDVPGGYLTMNNRNIPPAECKSSSCGRKLYPVSGEDSVYKRCSCGTMDCVIAAGEFTKISEAADVIQKLFLISQELPAGKFEGAKSRICARHDRVERELIVQFISAQRCGELERMRHLAGVLANFRGYNQCVDAFIEEMQCGIMRDVFSEVVPLCRRAQDVIGKVFTTPDQVMTKFVINIYQGQLKEHIQNRLSPSGSGLGGAPGSGEAYFNNLYDLYTKTSHLSQQLTEFSLDQTLLPQLTKAIFQAHLQAYISSEIKFLKERFSGTIQHFYQSKGHKKTQQSTGMKEIRMHLQDVLGATGLGSVEGHDGGCLLAEEVALSLLHETKSALARCTLLSSSNALASNAVQIYTLLTNALINEYVDYAIDLGVAGIPSGEVKVPPHLTFLTTMQQSSSILHLLHKLLHDTLLPLVIASPEHSGVLQRKRALVQRVQQRLSAGLDRLLTAVCLYTRHLLHTNQRRQDFKPEQDNMSVTGVSPACQSVCRWLSSVSRQLDACLDGRNLDTARLELGTRLHRTLLDHLQRFEYNTTGAMCVICDVNEYRKLVQGWRQPLVTSLFDALHTLCKLLQVSPQNLQIVCSGDQLAGLDRTVLANFIQLRADYKTAKLGAHFK